MNHAKLVKLSPHFLRQSKSQSGKRKNVHLSFRGMWTETIVVAYGHTWNEAFRRAAIALVTNRLSH